MKENGISEKTARSSVMDLKKRIEIKNHAQIYSSVIDSAKILGMPLLNIHQPCDEFGRRVISQKIQERNANLVSEIITALEEIPEFKKAESKIQGNLVILGHLAGDSIGINALGNKLENEGIQVVRKDIITI